MLKTPLQNPDRDSGRFQDPLGDHVRVTAAARDRWLNQYPQVNDVYEGFYARFEPRGKRGASYLGGAEGIIGTDLILKDFGAETGFVARDGQCVAVLESPFAERLSSLLRDGWVVRCILAATMYRSDERSLVGEFACIGYSPQLGEKEKQALETFVRNSTERIAGASRPVLELTQEQFVRIIESGGAWFLTGEQPWPELPKGSVFYRRRQTLTDHLTAAALKGNKGCLVASWAALALIAAAIIWALWRLFFSGG
jgi:hypothetical protein